MNLRALSASALIACSAVASEAGGLADGTDSSRSFASLSISTGTDTAWVFIDSVRRGRTPYGSDSLSPGAHALRLLEAGVSSWLSSPIVDTVVLSPGERRSLRYGFEHRVTIITDPSGAVIRIGDSLAGTTPLVVPPGGWRESGPVLLEKPGYERVTLSPSDLRGGLSPVILKKIWQAEGADLAPGRGTDAGRTSLRLYVAAGTTLAAGVAAAYFKIKADERNAAFVDTGDPSLAGETRRLDTAAAVSLAITQIGFAFLTYFLLSE